MNKNVIKVHILASFIVAFQLIAIGFYIVYRNRIEQRDGVALVVRPYYLVAGDFELGFHVYVDFDCFCMKIRPILTDRTGQLTCLIQNIYDKNMVRVCSHASASKGRLVAGRGYISICRVSTEGLFIIS